MQIISLQIDNHHCFDNFGIFFNTIDGGSSTILIGENGTGKSTMLKAVLDIIMSFDMMSLRSYSIANQISYNYLIEYEYAHQEIRIEKSGTRYIVFIDGDKSFDGSLLTVKLCLQMTKTRIFPERVVAFYSGNNDSFYENIKKQNIQYTKKCKSIFRDYIESLKSGEYLETISIPKRQFIYCDESFVPIYLCAIIAGTDSYEKEIIIKECGLSQIDHLDVTIKVEDTSVLDGTTGKRAFEYQLKNLIDYIDSRFSDSFLKGYQTMEGNKIVFSIDEISQLNLDSISILEFLEKLKVFYNAEYTVYANGIRDVYLSEGQRQLIKVLGMLGVCKSEDCLVLMDEPDAHMNPKWKYEIKDTIDKVLENSTNTQALIATHDPLVINGVSKEFIRIFERDNETDTTKVIVPDTMTEGMGIDGLLQSEYYGLPTVLDSETKKKMDKKHDLMIKDKNQSITPKEKKELEMLTEEIENMTFSRNIPTDIYYDEYVAAMHRIYRTRPVAKLTKKDINERNAMAEKILRDILKKHKNESIAQKKKAEAY